MDAILSIQNLCKSYQQRTVVDHLQLELRRGEFFSLLGPSGCGKSSTLRMIAGFEEPDSGRIQSEGQDWVRLPVRARNCNMVFQNYALFPHMTVIENVSFGLEMLKLSVHDARKKALETLRLVKMEQYAGRKPAQLSGGQQQRVALARAIAPEPSLLLLDEPLSALDQKLRQDMQAELKQLQRNLNSTFLFVTHDQDEAMALSDRMGIMSHGRLLQVGTPEELYDQPASLAVASFLGETDVFTLKTKQDSEELHGQCAETGLVGRLDWKSDHTPERLAVAIRPEFWECVNPDAIGVLRGQVIDLNYRGRDITYRIELSSGRRVQALFDTHRKLSRGETVGLRLKPERLWAIPEES